MEDYFEDADSISIVMELLPDGDLYSQVHFKHGSVFSNWHSNTRARSPFDRSRAADDLRKPNASKYHALCSRLSSTSCWRGTSRVFRLAVSLTMGAVGCAPQVSAQYGHRSP